MNAETLKKSYIRTPEGHRVWLGGPRVRYKGKLYYPARLLWQLLTGEILPKGIQLHRTCSHPLCISPEHHVKENKADHLRFRGLEGR